MLRSCCGTLILEQMMHKTFNEGLDLSYANWESAHTELVKQITLTKRSQCIEDFRAAKKCSTKLYPKKAIVH